MKDSESAARKSRMHYVDQLKKAEENLRSLADDMRLDKRLRDEITAFRVKKTVAKLDETSRLLAKTLDYLNGAKIEPDAKHPLIMPGQHDLL